MSTNEFDVIVIGMGPGGGDLAGQLAVAGLQVLGIDSHLVGGECPYYGCIPSKMIIRAADLLQEGRRINTMAGTAVIMPDYSIVASRIRDEATDVVRKLTQAQVAGAMQQAAANRGSLSGVAWVRSESVV